MSLLKSTIEVEECDATKAQ